MYQNMDLSNVKVLREMVLVPTLPIKNSKLSGAADFFS
jgi:hypothetical protein